MRPMTRTRFYTASDGFTMLPVIMLLMAISGLALAGWTAAGGDVAGAQRDTDAKRAYVAAESGLAEYQQKLAGDNEYWLKCLDVPNVMPENQPAPVNQQWNGTGPDMRQWRKLPSDPQAEYTIELLPANGRAECVPGVVDSMHGAAGIQVRTTGRVGPPNRQVKRSIISSLRRRGFLDFIYFTEYETIDPSQMKTIYPGEVRPCRSYQTCANESLAIWGASSSTCRRLVRPTQGVPGSRDDVRYTGSYQASPTGGWTDVAIPCQPIQFVGGDAIRGPFHTNDTMLVCDKPPFGRNRAGATDEPIDKIEYWAFRRGLSPPCATDSAPDTGNNRVLSGNAMENLKLPETNAELEAIAGPEYTFTGDTNIVVNGSSLTVDGASKDWPSSGVIYVRNDPTIACPPLNPLRPYATASSCGDAYISGTYSNSITIAAERDIVVSGDFTTDLSGTALAGLIATNFVRVEQRMTGASPTTACLDGTVNVSNSNRKIHAAIAALNHVFTVDHYQCGAGAGKKLQVTGAIAQKYRGPVGLASGAGYLKEYLYDDRLRYRSPPHFTTPTNSSWTVTRTTEQSPAT